MRAAGATGTGAAAIRRGAGVGSSLRAGLQRKRGSRGILDRTRADARSIACPSQAWGLGDKTATNPTPPACRQTCRAERRPSSKRYSIHHSGRRPGAPPVLQLRREPAGAKTHVQKPARVRQPLRHGLRPRHLPISSDGEETMSCLLPVAQRRGGGAARLRAVTEGLCGRRRAPPPLRGPPPHCMGRRRNF